MKTFLHGISLSEGPITASSSTVLSDDIFQIETFQIDIIKHHTSVFTSRKAEIIVITSCLKERVC